MSQYQLRTKAPRRAPRTEAACFKACSLRCGSHRSGIRSHIPLLAFSRRPLYPHMWTRWTNALGLILAAALVAVKADKVEERSFHEPFNALDSAGKRTVPGWQMVESDRFNHRWSLRGMRCRQGVACRAGSIFHRLVRRCLPGRNMVRRGRIIVAESVQRLPGRQVV